MDIARHFLLAFLRRAEKSLLEGTLLSVRYKNRIKEQAFECYPYQLHFNNLLATGYYILSVKIITKYSKEDLLVLIIFYVCTFCRLYTVH